MAFEITVPRLGWSMEEGIFAGWQKKDGDLIRRGDILFELEGEKALQEIESVDEGYLAIPPNGPQPGTVIKVGAVVGYLLSKGESIPGSNDVDKERSAEAETPRSQECSPAAPPSVRRLAREMNVPLNSIEGSGAGGRITAEDVASAATKLTATTTPAQSPAKAVVATPRARRAAEQLGIRLADVTGSGRHGRIRERDVIRKAGESSLETSRHNPRVALSGRRKIIAERLSASARQTVPVTITSRADATNLVALRSQFKASGHEPVPAVHDIVVRLTADSLRDHLLLASCWDGDSTRLPDPEQIHIGLAVDSPEGLIVPVLRNVSTQSLMSLATESARIIQKARSGRLTPSEMQGAVFTISNLGHFGIDAFTPVINLPETAILGLGTIRKEPVVSNDGQIEIRQIMTLSLTFDHRVIDGAPAARFLQSLIKSIENPAARLLTIGS